MPNNRIKADVIIHHIGQLATIAGYSNAPCVRADESNLGLIGKASAPNVCVAATNGRICYFGPQDNLSEKVATGSAEEIDARGALVVPGFVDPHTHAIFAGSREGEINDKLEGLSYLEILAKGGGILRTMRDTRNATDNDLFTQTKSRLEKMMSLGTTTVEIKTGYGLDVKNELRLLQVIDELRKSLPIDIVPTLLSAHAIPPEFAGNVSSYIEQVVFPTIDLASEKNLADFCDVFMEEGVFGRVETREIFDYARSKEMKLKIHADEFSDLGGAALASASKVASADHLMRASKEGISALANAGVLCVLLPGTSFSSFSTSYANAREIARTGAPIALGTDLSPNSWILSMQFVMSMSCYGMRMTPAETLVGATINSAHAIDKAREVGSIEIGKKCDLVITELSNYEEMPYRIGANFVGTVIKEGRIVANNQS